jgi:hypothetical protein
LSLHRFVYYAAIIGGWAAFLAWMIAEPLFFRQPWLEHLLHAAWLAGAVQSMLTSTLVGAGLGVGLILVSGMANAQWRRQLRRAVPGLVIGGISGAVGGLLGQLLYLVGIPRMVGWMIMGLGIGSAEGICDRSSRKLRNGLIGGGLGGLIAGALFSWIAPMGPEVPMRATGFVILGVSIGALIGLAHVVLKEAWLTVVDGFRPGRQVILSEPMTYLGRGDHLPLPLLGYAGRDLESEHARITRQPDGQYTIQDNQSRIGTILNGRPLQGPAILADGDLIRLGSNILRFNHRHHKEGPAMDAVPSASPAGVAAGANACDPIGPGGYAGPPAPPAPPPGTPLGQVGPTAARPAPRGSVPWQRTAPPQPKPPRAGGVANRRIPPPPPPPPG